EAPVQVTPNGIRYRLWRGDVGDRWQVEARHRPELRPLATQGDRDARRPGGQPGAGLQVDAAPAVYVGEARRLGGVAAGDGHLRSGVRDRMRSEERRGGKGCGAGRA